MLIPNSIVSMEATKLAVQGVSKRFNSLAATVRALDNLSLDVADREFVCLVGPSGCGKTTLLDIIAGLTKPDEGRVLADGLPVEGPGRQRLVMFQESALFPWLTVFGNVMFGLKLRDDLRDAERRRIAFEHLHARAVRRYVAACGARARVGA